MKIDQCSQNELDQKSSDGIWTITTDTLEEYLESSSILW